MVTFGSLVPDDIPYKTFGHFSPSTHSMSNYQTLIFSRNNLSLSKMREKNVDSVLIHFSLQDV